jgi:hypothetical protein|tara:strand:+ start:886 stop:1272 length:387 start_codon:yes stop_codon:yes gene_type:complete
MPSFRSPKALADRKDLDSKKVELVRLKDNKTLIASSLKDFFSEDGSIKRSGLENELLRLDILRRSKNPVDNAEQCLIQGQQNEVTHLLQLESGFLKEKENILERINELENETQALIDGLQRRSKNDDR